MSNWKTDHSEKIFRFCYEEITPLDYEDYHLPHYSLLYKEELLYFIKKNSEERVKRQLFTSCLLSFLC